MGQKTNKKRQLAASYRDILRFHGIEPKDITLEIAKNNLIEKFDEEIFFEVKSQERGIPYEYEFGALCRWLGKCPFLQFIDSEPEYPYITSIKDISYPDIFAIFDYKKSKFPCFIEIKVHNSSDVFTLTPNYVRKLEKYPLLNNYPLLIAWRFREHWTLFDINTFKNDKGGLKATFEEAAKASLLSMLVGDFFFRGFKKGVKWGITIGSKKLMKEIREKKIKQFLGTIKDLCVYDPPKDNRMEISTPLFYLLPYLGTWETFDEFNENNILTGEKNVLQMSMSAYQALIFGTYFWAEITKKMVDWKYILGENKFIFNVDDLNAFINEGRKKKMGFEHTIVYRPSIENPCLAQ